MSPCWLSHLPALPGRQGMVWLDPGEVPRVQWVPEASVVMLPVGTRLPAQPGGILPEPDMVGGLVKSYFLLPRLK